jgi:hypothetical protein
MPSKFVKVDATNLKKIVAQYQEITGKSMPDLVRSFARVCAVELANRTQPFTVGSNGRSELERGTGHLRKDINKAVKTKDTVREKAETLTSEDLQRRMIYAVDAGRYDILAKLLVAVKIIRTEGDFHLLAGGTIREFHKQQRSHRTGHTLAARGQYNLAPTGFDPYVKEVAKRLGYTKSGWSECARKIGGVKGDGARGIPAFAKRQRGSNWNVEDHSGDKKEPYFIMTNTTPWIGKRLLPERRQKEAQGIASQRMIKAMNMALRHAAKAGVDVRSFVEKLKDEAG